MSEVRKEPSAWLDWLIAAILLCVAAVLYIASFCVRAVTLIILLPCLLLVRVVRFLLSGRLT